jgi:hypothetical protein
MVSAGLVYAGSTVYTAPKWRAGTPLLLAMAIASMSRGWSGPRGRSAGGSASHSRETSTGGGRPRGTSRHRRQPAWPSPVSSMASDTSCSLPVTATEVVYGAPPVTAALSRQNFSTYEDDTLSHPLRRRHPKAPTTRTTSPSDGGSGRHVRHDMIR